MPPLPKKKTSKARRGKRQSHLGLSLPALDTCPQCHSPKLSHRACPVCGSYAGREVIEIKSPKKKEQ
jgi:large subunit ribosomal protein L32